MTAVSLVGFETGGLVRRHVHVLIPVKDPATMGIFALCLAPALMGYDSIWYLAAMITFMLTYGLAYVREEFDMVYVNVHTIISEKFPTGAQEVKPVVYYWDRDGVQCYQDQSLKEIFKTVFLGIHTPLRLDIGQIRRTRPIFVQKVLLPLISVDAIDVVEEKFEDTEVQKWRFTLRCRSVAYTPAPSCIDTTQQWLVSAHNQELLQKELTRKEAQLLEAKTSAMSSYYARSADLLVEMINDRTPGAEVYNEITSRFAPDPEQITVREPRQRPDAPKAKRRSILKRGPKDKDKESEPEPDDDGYEEGDE